MTEDRPVASHKKRKEAKDTPAAALSEKLKPKVYSYELNRLTSFIGATTNEATLEVL
jgi:hypothetical protein